MLISMPLAVAAMDTAHARHGQDADRTTRIGGRRPDLFTPNGTRGPRAPQPNTDQAQDGEPVRAAGTEEKRPWLNLKEGQA